MTVPDRPPALSSRIVWRLARPVVRGVGRAMWGLRFEGAGFPPPPFVIAANHHSFLDAPLVGAAYGHRQRFLTLVDLFGNYRLLDWTLRTFEVIEVRRGSVPLGPIRTAIGYLRAGGVVSVFPEGIRAVRFGDVPLRRGAAWLAVRTGVPLVAVAVIGTGEVLGTDNRLHRGRIRIVVGPSLRPGEGPHAVDDLHRRWAAWIASVVPGAD